MSSSDSITTLSAHLDHIASLHAQAKHLMPYKVDSCSFPQGHLRQKIWSCRTCAAAYGRNGQGQGVGVCYACSVSCHAEHDLVELFVRRGFQCDCPTLPGPTCTLLSPASPTTPPLAPATTPATTHHHPPRNPLNKYTRNFQGEFCRCPRGLTYDPLTEAESMVECLACEDWFHESCLNLQDPSNPTPHAETTSSSSSTSSSTENESPLLPSSAYAHLICSRCTLANPLLRRYAGTEGWMMISPSSSPAHAHVDSREHAVEAETVRAGKPAAEVEWKDKWMVIGRKGGNTTDEHVETPTAVVGEKRKTLQSDELSIPATKRAKFDPESGTTPRASSSTQKSSPSNSVPVSSLEASISTAPSTCTAPPPNPAAQTMINALLLHVSSATSASATASASSPAARPIPLADLFLQEGARESICSCPTCVHEVRGLSFPLVEEEEYEPEMEDTPDPTEEELTDQALSVLPRSQAIEGLLKFNAMKDRLKEFLEPFRDGGKVVSAADIEEFMDSFKHGE